MARRAVTQDRLSADERREQVLAAAIVEFAEFGYHAARTAGIAERAGISQPYVYALFPNKKVLFLACLAEVGERISAAFASAARPTSEPREALNLLGAAYKKLLVDRDVFRCQLQGHAASSDPEIQAAMRDAFMRRFELVQELTGASTEQVSRFFATGQLLTVGAMLDLPLECTLAPFD
jgi:AcrR family transcriptional regulator